MSNLNARSSDTRRHCILCRDLFEPHVKVKDRQRVCSRLECQRLRQKLNHTAWLEKNTVASQPANRQRPRPDSGEALEPRIAPQRQSKRVKAPRQKPTFSARQEGFQVLSRYYEEMKKEQLSPDKTASKIEKRHTPKEQLTSCFYLIRGRDIVLFALHQEK